MGVSDVPTEDGADLAHLILTTYQAGTDAGLASEGGRIIHIPAAGVAAGTDADCVPTVAPTQARMCLGLTVKHRRVKKQPRWLPHYDEDNQGFREGGALTWD